MAAAALEVFVLLAVLRRGDLDEHLAPAAAAIDARLEVVRVLARALALAVQFEDGLHLLPGRLVYQRRVVAGVLGSLEGDDSLVVGFFSMP